MGLTFLLAGGLGNVVDRVSVGGAAWRCSCFGQKISPKALGLGFRALGFRVKPQRLELFHGNVGLLPGIEQHPTPYFMLRHAAVMR